MEKKNQLKSCCKNSLSSPNTHHSSSRPCGRQERGTEAAHTLYPAYRPCGMMERVGRVVRMANSGFTLIELLVVVLIIGILAAVALPQYQKAVDKSRYSNLMAITKAIADANETYYLANGQYATHFDELSVDLPATSINEGSATFEWGYCYLIDQQEAQCTNNTTLKNQYIIQYLFSPRATHRAQAVCTAITQTAGSRFDKVCSSIGTYSHNDSCVPGLCRLYVIHKRQ